MWSLWQNTRKEKKTMLIYKKGDILKSTEDIICHQCNTQGIFGGGLAYQIKQVYPLCEKRTIEWLNVKEDFMGNYYLYVNKLEKRLIANCFTQNEDYTTNYEMLEKCFSKILNNCKNMKQTVCVPYKYGCGIANGDWNIVENIFKELSEKEQVDITIYEYNKEEI